MNLNELAKQIHHANNKNWWTDYEGMPIVRNRGELLMLVITELAEAVEGIRKDLHDDHLPQFKMEVVEMADAKIRLLDYAGGFNLKLYEGPSAFNVIQGENKANNILLICAIVCNALNCDVFVNSAILAIDQYCLFYELDLEPALQAKLAYNKSRHDHSHEARAMKHGKAF